MSNNDLWTRTNHIRIDLEIRSGWLGHILRKPPNEIPRLALDWNPQGSRGWGRPKVAWRRTVLQEANITGKSWNERKHTATNTVRWKNLAEAQYSDMELWVLYMFGTGVVPWVYCLTTDSTIRRSGFDPQQKQNDFYITSMYRPVLMSIRSPIQWVPGVLSQGINHGRGVTLTTHCPSSAELRNEYEL
jgi:hypothetical protein